MVIHFHNQLLFKPRGRNYFCRETDLYLGNVASAKKILIAFVKLSDGARLIEKMHLGAIMTLKMD